MHSAIPLTRDLVLIGGGHTHALLLRRWGMDPLPGARLTVVNPTPTAPYTGMLPGHIAGHYTREALEIDLVRLARFAGARLVLGRATGIDRDARHVAVEGRPPIRYDIASIDIGITSHIPDLPGFAAHGVAAKPLGPFASQWAAFCDAVRRGDTDPSVAVIGAGIAGVELALAMRHRLEGLGAVPKVTLIEAERAISTLAGDTRVLLFNRLWHCGIRLIEGDPAVRATSTEVQTASGRCIPAALTVGASGARPHPWLSELGLAHRAGYITVDPCLRSVTDRAIFAAGDCADLAFAPRPKAGVYAVRAAPVLTANLRAALGGGSFRRFHPQKDYLKLISLGGREAVADRSGLTLAGPGIWRWKDRIDRAFMKKLARLPAMRRPSLPRPRANGVAATMGVHPPCAGCGGKVGPGGLRAALSQLPAPKRSDVASHPGDDAAVLTTGGVTQVLSTDHVRAFCEDPVVFGRVTAVHALGDIWAMGAIPQAATATVVLPRMTPEMAEATLAELLAAASAVLRDQGADLVGGHTTLGAEFTFGLTVTGLCDRAPLTLSGARPGDALILTRPIGSGTLLAAEMRMKADGDDIAALFATMERPQSDAARALVAAGARAMTDVTGFGLAGHLMNLCDASSVGACLRLNDVPLFAGAEDLAGRGVRSTLWPENAAALSGRIHGWKETARAALLFDPQTAGGLLAAVPSVGADAAVSLLRNAGHAAAVIGEVTDAPPGIELRD